MYAGVMLEDGGKVWSVLNVRGLAIPELAGRVAEPVVYDGETPDARIARRKQKWTPTEIVGVEVGWVRAKPVTQHLASAATNVGLRAAALTQPTK